MLYLASQSPRRRQLLEQLGLKFGIVDIDVPEIRDPGESVEDYVIRVAREKACAGFKKLDGDSGVLVLGADTEVVLNDRVFGKPASPAHAVEMLVDLSGRTHRVLSAVCCAAKNRVGHAIKVSEVSFAALTRAEIDAYVASSEPQGKAGAYAIQGQAAAFITHLNGSYSAVMGLPLYETAQLLRDFGIGNELNVASAHLE